MGRRPALGETKMLRTETVRMTAQPRARTKDFRVVHFTEVNCTVSELYPSKAGFAVFEVLETAVPTGCRPGPGRARCALRVLHTDTTSSPSALLPGRPPALSVAKASSGLKQELSS